MNNRGAADVQTIVTIIIAVVLIAGVAIGATFAVLPGVVSPTVVVNESHTIVNGSTNFTLAHYPIDLTQAANVLTLQNATGNMLVQNVNYTLQGVISGVSANGTIQVQNVNTTFFGTSVLVTYGYQQSGYDTSGTDRTILQLTPLALGLMLLVLVLKLVQNSAS